MSHVPSLWAFLLLALASYRTWHLLAEDTILDRPRRALLRLGDWRTAGDPVPDTYRTDLGEFIRCPWCLGFWIATAWWAAWLVWDDTLVVAVPFALSAVLALANAVVSALTE